MNLNTFLNNTLVAVVNPLIVLGFVVSLLIFIYGIVRYIWRMSDDAERSTGKSAMVWGLFGILIMFSVFGIINLILGALGLNGLKLPWIR